MTEIYEYAAENGFIAGVCSAEVLTPPKGTKLPWNFEEKSVIVIGVGYGMREDFAVDKIPRGRLAMYTIGEDYHAVVRGKLEGLRDYLNKHVVSFESYIHVDSGPLPERKLALAAGIGRLGKNGCIISDRFGSFFNIGCMVVDCEIADAGAAICRPLVGCDDCGACVKACPTGVFKDNDYAKCISAITQKKGELSEWEQAAMGNHLFGCDICQFVCPCNKGKHIGVITDIDGIMPRLDSVLAMAESEYSEKYGNTAMSWRGLSVLQRNAEIVYKNLRKGDN